MVVVRTAGFLLVPLVALAVLAAACGSDRNGTNADGGADADGTATADADGTATADPAPDEKAEGAEAEDAEAGDGDAAGADATGDADGPAAGAEPGDSIAFELLRTLPPEPETLIGLTFADLERAETSIGLTRPEPGDEEGFGTWLKQLSGFADEDAGPQAFAQIPVFRNDRDPTGWTQAFGFSLLDTRAVIEGGEPPGTVIGFAVSATAADIEEAVTSDPAWSAELEVLEGPGGPYYQWSAEGELSPDRVGPGRPLGRGGLLAERDGIVVRGVIAEPFLASLQAWSTGPSLADVPEVAELFHALDDAGTHSFTVVDGLSGPLPDLDAASIDELRQQLREDQASAQLVPFLFAAAGVTVLDETPLDVVAYVHDSPESAAANEERIRTLIETGRSTLNDRSWSEVYRVRSVTSRGSVSLAVLEPIDGLPGKALGAAFQRDSLFWFGE